jgi:glycosyltransferase involved in cell wall biosynthesis
VDKVERLADIMDKKFDMIRIAFMESMQPWDEAAGGVASYVQHRAWVLGKRGFEVWWFNRLQCARWNSQENKWEGVHTFESGGLRGRLDFRQTPVWSFLTNQVHVDIVEFADIWARPLPCEKRGNLTPKFVIACHTSTITRCLLNKDKLVGSSYNRLRDILHIDHWQTRRNIRRADGVIACSYEIALLEAGLFRIHPDYFTVIPHAFSSTAESGFSLKAEDKPQDFFLIVGNMEYLKGFDLIMSGFCHYRRQGGAARLFFAGSNGFADPSARVQRILSLPRVVNALKEVGAESVCFLGRLGKNELATLRSRSIATIVGSRFESFSMVAGEVVMTRCPLILSNRTGWRCLAERFHGARLFDPLDPEDLATAMKEMENPVQRRVYQQGGDQIAAYLQSEELISKTVRFYCALLDQNYNPQ